MILECLVALVLELYRFGRSHSDLDSLEVAKLGRLSGIR